MELVKYPSLNSDENIFKLINLENCEKSIKNAKIYSKRRQCKDLKEIEKCAALYGDDKLEQHYELVHKLLRLTPVPRTPRCSRRSTKG